MKKKFLATVCIILVMASIWGMSAMAAANKVVYLPENQTWSLVYDESRSGSYSYVQVGCDSVYPASGTDNFQKIQARIVDVSGNVIMNSSSITLTEGAGLSNVSIKEGYLHLTKVCFQFRGNTNSAANAVVDYYGN